MPNFKEVVTTKIYLPFKAMKQGDVVIPNAKYLGRSPNKFGKENFEFEDEKGVISVLNHCGGLDLKFETIAPGAWVRITYNGQKEIPKGDFKGKMFHDFSVAVDQDRLTAPTTPDETETEKQLDLMGL